MAAPKKLACVICWSDAKRNKLLFSALVALIGAGRISTNKKGNTTLCQLSASWLPPSHPSGSRPDRNPAVSQSHDKEQTALSFSNCTGPERAALPSVPWKPLSGRKRSAVFFVISEGQQACRKQSSLARLHQTHRA
jgi:hypothetical protein